MSHVQSTGATTGSVTSSTLTLNGVASGHTLLAFLRVSTGSDVITSVSDNVNAGNWTQIANILGSSIRLYVYKKENVAAGNTTVTWNASGANTARWAIAEYTEGLVDAISSATTFTTTTTPTSPNATSTVSGDTIIGVVATDGNATSISAANGETPRQTIDTRMQFQDKAAGAGGTYSSSWTLGTTNTGEYLTIAMKAVATKFRRTLSAIGTRVGKRQVQF